MNINKRKLLGCIGGFWKRYAGIIVTVLVTLVAFWGLFKILKPVNTNSLSGAHSWLSGSTIKFVNNWLREGASNLNFTNYENPASIEFGSIEERGPYLSYPTGETFFVYIAARVMGKDQITISFLHKFQIIMFAIESVLLSCFVYLFLTRSLSRKNEVEKILIAVLTAILWILMPTCFYYLSNIYFADQCVILWIMGLILVEYLFRTSDRRSMGLKIIRSVILFSGILIDYYFWFLALLIFVAEALDVWLRIEKGKRKCELLKIFCWFAIPVALALIVYYVQLTQTASWFEEMRKTFDGRVLGKEQTSEWIFTTILLNFSRAFSIDDRTINYLILILVVTVVAGVGILIKRKKLSALILKPGLSVMVCGVASIVMQIFVFKQHSAVHEFSMTKVGWVIAILPIVMTVLLCYMLFVDKKMSFKKIKTNKVFSIFLMCYAIVFFAVGIPFSTIDFKDSRIENVDYTLETIVAQETDFEDVLFSYTEEIPFNPPRSLAISNKRIYKVKSLKEIVEVASELPDEANVVLVINKNGDKDLGIDKEQKCLKKNGDIRWEDEKYQLIDLRFYEKCYNKER